MKCKSCDNLLAGHEEAKELCYHCQLKEYIEPKTRAILAMIGSWELNGASTRELISQIIDAEGGA